MSGEILGDVSGILVPGGFGSRGIDGKILAIQYARENKHPVPRSVSRNAAAPIVEFARDVVGYTDAHSARA